MTISTTAAEHVITVDEEATLTDGTAFKAFCGCGWSENHWHHTDEFPESDDEASAATLAIGAADDAGLAHIIEAQENAAWAARERAPYRRR